MAMNNKYNHIKLNLVWFDYIKPDMWLNVFRETDAEWIPKEFSINDLQKRLTRSALKTYKYNLYMAYKQLNSGKCTDTQYKKRIIAIYHIFDLINDYEYDSRIIDINYDSVIDKDRYKRAKAEVDLNHEKISEREYEKIISTLDKEPWVYIEFIPDTENPEGGAFDWDYNEFYIEALKEKGYVGTTDDEIMEDYLNNICRYVAIDEYEGIGNFDEMVGHINEASESYKKARTSVNVTKSDDGTTSYE